MPLCQSYGQGEDDEALEDIAGFSKSGIMRAPSALESGPKVEEAGKQSFFEEVRTGSAFASPHTGATLPSNFAGGGTSKA